MKTFTSEFKRNPQELPIGSVAYYINRDGHRWSVDFGIVADHYPSEIFLDRLDFPEYRMIDGIPVQEISFPTRWQKLPKGWSYDTLLFKTTWDPIISQRIAANIKLDDPQSILDAYKSGILVKVWGKSYGCPRDEIDNQNGWRIIWENDPKYHPAYVSLNWNEVYKTYAEAHDVITKHTNSLHAISEMSDYDWAIQEIDNVLDKWCGMYDVTAEEKQQYRDWILSRERVEDVEVRLAYGKIQWKYTKNKRWADIVL